ncbi:MAG: hypothetical protein DRN61_00010 [Thaumarchaeota archaeon]|nr:MAG: hypothetical protein DRN61_00010 [Nitrososphaerota archaeon]
MSKYTKAEVFIIESLEFDDEKNNRFEGKFLSQILHLGGKKPKYYYVRTKKELKKVLELFEKSAYRYLHLSCHGSETSISTTLDSISFKQLKELMGSYLRKKRLFISACSAVNEKLAKYLIPSSGCLSIIGPVADVEFRDAAIIYASFYHLMFKKSPSKMTRREIKSILLKVADIFEISLNYFSISKKYGFKGIQIKPRKRIIEIYPRKK